MLEMLKTDIIRVISNYVEIDEAEMDIQLSQVNLDDARNVPMLLANIPIRGVRKTPRQV
jgi:cell division topological specificity factor